MTYHAELGLGKALNEGRKNPFGSPRNPPEFKLSMDIPYILLGNVVFFILIFYFCFSVLFYRQIGALFLVEVLGDTFRV